jgi:hypothetical protein
MAKWSFAQESYTPVAVADTTNMTSGGYMAVQGGSSTQRIDIQEVFMGGQAGASSPSFMTLARDSTVGASTSINNTGATNAALDPATAALVAPQVVFDTATTASKRSSSLAKLSLSFNAFGGIVRWVAPPGGEFRMVGNTASLGEVSLSAFTGGTVGLQSGHIIYEPL